MWQRTLCICQRHRPVDVVNSLRGPSSRSRGGWGEPASNCSTEVCGPSKTLAAQGRRPPRPSRRGRIDPSDPACSISWFGGSARPRRVTSPRVPTSSTTDPSERGRFATSGRGRSAATPATVGRTRLRPDRTRLRSFPRSPASGTKATPAS